MKTHELKIWQPWFTDVVSGRKTFEFRKDDRGFQTGDRLLLREYDPKFETYTGSAINVKVSYIMRWCPDLPAGYVIMGIKHLEES